MVAQTRLLWCPFACGTVSLYVACCGVQQFVIWPEDLPCDMAWGGVKDSTGHAPTHLFLQNKVRSLPHLWEWFHGMFWKDPCERMQGNLLGNISITVHTFWMYVALVTCPTLTSHTRSWAPDRIKLRITSPLFGSKASYFRTSAYMSTYLNIFSLSWAAHGFTMPTWGQLKPLTTTTLSHLDASLIFFSQGPNSPLAFW